MNSGKSLGVSIFKKPLATEKATAEISALNKYLGYYQNLHSQVITGLRQMLIQYSTGDFASLEQTLTQENYNLLSSRLIDYVSLQNVPDTYVYNPLLFRVYTETFHRVLEGLLKSERQYKTLKDVSAQLISVADKAAILDDMERLREYLEARQNQSVLTEIDVKLNLIATLKPQYQRYVELYGLPPDLVFESQKLAEIIQELLTEGAINEEDVFG